MPDPELCLTPNFLVLLDGDPLADIRNSRRIYAVMLNGRWLAQ